ncbi:MAG: Nucleolar protein 58 [Vezdaea aestivalis]|nr:MAG: Nucleolar protein 58 [Vezdaea aestivalis]
MPLFVLAETAVGLALFKAKDKKLLKRESLAKDIETADGVCNQLKLKQFKKFDSAATALEEVTALIESKVTPFLSSLLDGVKDEKKASLAVADPKLGKAIKAVADFDLVPVYDDQTAEIYRSIRSHIPSLVPGLNQSDIDTMTLGLSHSLARHKLKFSPEKIDVMIVHAIGLLDDLDKDLNTNAMRVKEWYGWHFPELAKIINDNLAYARIIVKMGFRTSASKTDLSGILPEEIETAVKAAAEVSMGMEMTDDDLENIQSLAEQVIGLTEYRQQLSSHLSARMAAIAPNLTMLVGELVGARLIAHAGSLMNLSKNPGSTIQLLGAEKALFRALKTKHDTPKYGLIYHASLIGQASGKNKGKIARMLASKAALGIRIDSLADWDAEEHQPITEEDKAAFGLNARVSVEGRLRALEGKTPLPRGVAIGPSGISAPSKFEIKEARKYNINADALDGNEPAQHPIASGNTAEELVPLEEKAIKKLIEEVKMEIDEVDEKEEVEPEEESADEAEDQEMKDDEESSEAPTEKPSLTVRTTPNGKAANGYSSDHSKTLSEVSDNTADSPDSPTAQELNWQSIIPGNTKEAKRARKRERHERKLALSESRSAAKKVKKEKLARIADRDARRRAKQDQLDRRAERDNEQYAELAAQANLSVVRFKRKLDRGEITIDTDGKPVVVSKKDKKREERGERESRKKRKREEEGVETGVGERLDKKKKKKSKI